MFRASPPVAAVPPAPASADPAALQRELDGARAQIAAHAAWLQDLQQGLSDVRIAYGERLESLDRWMTSTVTAVSTANGVPVLGSPELERAFPVDGEHLTEQLRRQLLVWTTTSWLRLADPQTALLVSVVLVTRNRATHLGAAVASVLAQTHGEVELLVVDDASEDDTAGLLAAIEDPRLRVVRLSAQVGASAARNAGLDAATGDVVAYLDDDNLMAPEWLQAVAWAFDRWPESQLLYGARLIEDAAARNRHASGSLPSLEFIRYSRRRLERSNGIDMNTIAHRRGLSGWRFDPEIRASIEWEVMLRVTLEHTPLELPVVACAYGSYAPERISDRFQRVDEARRIRATIPLRRPLRVLAYTQMFPLLSETYIQEEMLALAAHGAEIAYCSVQRSVSPYPVAEPIYPTFAAAVDGHDPDLVVLHWADHAEVELPALAAHGRPFAVRAHSFDFDPERMRRLLAHPLCVGVWAFPHQAAQVPGVHPLNPPFTRHADVPPPAARTSVLSVSAGLSKKDWPTLLAAFDLLPDLDRQIIVARSNGQEHVVAALQAAAAGRASPPTVRVNVPRAEVFAQLASASVCLYTLSPGPPVGMPMSIVEALYAGACVVHADREELRPMLGGSWRPYRSAQDIADHVREVCAGGPAIEQERARNSRFARATFCSPEVGATFSDELRAALSRWLLAVG
jgi:hypothetical protein